MKHCKNEKTCKIVMLKQQCRQDRQDTVYIQLIIQPKTISTFSPRLAVSNSSVDESANTYHVAPRYVEMSSILTTRCCRKMDDDDDDDDEAQM